MEPASLALILGASAASSAASMYNNRQNIKYAQEANDETIGLANTAHQREVRDLIAAGLNPLLSATGSGAATPSLRVPNLESIDGGIANNAGGLARYVSQQQRLLNAKTAAETDSSIASAENLRAQNQNLHEQNENLKAERENIKADTVLKQKQSKSRTPVGGAIEDLETHSSPVVNSGKALVETAKALEEARKESKREIPIGVSDRTLHIMEQRGMSPEEVMRRVYEHRTRKGKK